VTFTPKKDVSFKKPTKTPKTRFEVGFLGGFFGWVFWVLLGGFIWAGFLLPTLFCSETVMLIALKYQYRN
jgi:hypothetical protein